MSLDLIKKDDLSRKIKKEFKYTFSVDQNGIYAVVVLARAKSWFQNTFTFTSFFADDNLAARINGVKFPKLFGKQGEFNGEASWNGNKLKGLKQINFFVVNLEKGEQDLEFVSRGSPLLESIEIYKINKNKISIDPSKYIIEYGNRRPWFNILTNQIGIISISAKAVAGTGKDDNDLQIRINGLREQSNESRAHKYWFWCGRVLKGQPKIFERTVGLKPGFNYIEFWVDGTPFFSELNIRVTMSDRIPSVDDPLWTGDFYDDSEEMILARLIFGEARSQFEEARIWVAGTVINRVKAHAWPNTIHDVILDSDQFNSFKPDDPNSKWVKNPLLDLTQKQSWIDCYNIAKGILNSSIKNPTEATHFHDSRLSQEDFMKLIPNGKFLKRIDDLFFYWSPN